MHAEATGNHSTHGFASFRIHPQRFVVHALLQLETPNGLRWIGRFVNVDWHSRLSLLARVALRRFFRRGSFFRWRFLRFHPLGVKHARPVHAFVGVRAKEIALRLKQV